MRFDLSKPWAIEPSYAVQCLPQVLNNMASGKLDEPPQPYKVSLDEPPHDWKRAALALDSDAKGSFLAVVPLSGPLSPEAEYGGTSTNAFRRQVAALDRRSDVAGIVIDITSPGGTVTGTMEAADALRNVQTPTLAVANGLMASGATWIGTAADRTVLTPSGEAGSIGVISIYTDMSEAYSKFGMKFEIERVPEDKARFTGVEPLTDDMREQMIDENNQAYEKFVGAMAQNRGIAASEVEGRFGAGRMLSAEKSVEVGLVDGIATLEQAISEFAATLRTPGSNRRAASAGRRVKIAELDTEMAELDT